MKPMLDELPHLQCCESDYWSASREGLEDDESISVDKDVQNILFLRCVPQDFQQMY